MAERGEARLAMRSALQQDAVWKGINRVALFCRYQRGTEAEKDDYTVTGYNYL